MQVLPLLFFQIVLFIGYGLVQARNELNNAIYSPEKGILCDEKLGFCADKFGVSMAFTKEFLGQSAQEKLRTRIMISKDKNINSTGKYSFSNKIYCNSAIQKCFINKLSNNEAEEYNVILFE